MEQNIFNIFQIENINEVLKQLKINDIDLKRKISAEGLITQRRSFKNRIFLMLEIQDKSKIQLVISDEFQNQSSHLKDVEHYVRINSKLKCEGYAGCDRENSLSLYIENMQILQCSPDPTAIKMFLDIPFYDKQHIASCLMISIEQLDQLQSIKTSNQKQFTTQIANLSRQMLGQPGKRSRQRPQYIPQNELESLIDAENLYKQYIWSIQNEQLDSENIKISYIQQDLLNIPDNNEDLPSARGPLTRGDYFHGKKEPQILWIVEQMKNIKNEFNHVIDVGGGRGDLGMLIAEQFPQKKVTVVDMNKQSLEQGKLTAQKRNLRNIEFICEKFSLNFEANYKIEFLVALHACGGLTDLALQYAVKQQCPFLICPCCYVKTPINLFDEQNVFKLPYRDNILLKLCESEHRNISQRSSILINSERLNFVSQNSSNVKLQLKHFPSIYSLRNLVLQCEKI